MSKASDVLNTILHNKTSVEEIIKETQVEPKAQDLDKKFKIMRLGVNTRFEVELDKEVFTMRLLSRKEYDECSISAQEYFMDMPESKRVEEVKDNEFISYILEKALSKSPTELTWTKKEIDMWDMYSFRKLFDTYCNVVKEYNQSPDTITNEKFKELVDNLEKKQVSLKELTHEQLVLISTHYIELYQNIITQIAK